MKTKVLIVDDEKKIGMIVSRLLLEEGYLVASVTSGTEALKKITAWNPHLLLLDLKMPKMDGFAVLQQLQKSSFPGKVIVMTAFGTIPSAVKAMKSGAYDYITKPFDNDLLLHTVRRAAGHAATEDELGHVKEQLEERHTLSGIITGDKAMTRLFETVRRAAPTDMPVLVTGESGTGKELFARAIHTESNRSAGPFIPLNCGAIPDALIESELFGHKKGSFSGAVNEKRGLVEEADKGTLFLDEVGELGQGTQVKLLRFLQDSQFMPVGSTTSKSVDVRIIAATNRDLQQEIEAERFRNDLFFRLNVINLEIPPLRNRIDDIKLLVEHFIKKHGPSLDRNSARLNNGAMRTLFRHSWPGNVRELENTIKRLLVLVPENEIKQKDIEMVLIPTQAANQQDDRPLGDIVADNQEQLERGAIVTALSENNGNRTRTAENLGIGRNTLLRKLKKYGIN